MSRAAQPAGVGPGPAHYVYSARMFRAAAIAVLGAVYGGAALLARILGRRAQGALRRSQGARRRSGRILVIGTFHNPNWFHSHVRPLVRSQVGELILVCDGAVAPIEGVRFECPPRWMARLLSRAGAKFLWALRCALRYRPDLYMGYHIFPSAVAALAVSRLFGRPACYQMTAGPSELEGGGWNVENRVLAALRRPSPWVERLAHRVAREFDSVVVRGSSAEAYLRRIGYRGSLAAITGSVEPAGAWREFSRRGIDLAFVGRLAEDKRPDRFIAVVAALAAALPQLRAVMVGDGPEAETLKRLAREAGIEGRLELLGQRADVDAVLADTRVFVLTSRSEGVSIAMLEAMAAGAVPVVADVGDLADFVENDVNGYLVAQDDIAAYARAARALLTDEALWRRLSRRALSGAIEASGTDAVAGRWRRHLRGVL